MFLSPDNIQLFTKVCERCTKYYLGWLFNADVRLMWFKAVFSGFYKNRKNTINPWLGFLDCREKFEHTEYSRHVSGLSEMHGDQ